ncbi:dienelactone hydrolase family protein [Ralstonia soli]|uniref:Alpha/beta hydrolase n=1 Tax=Ralstonia soli TaxID=2953896 RepID=A0ABT1AKF9_9RALS|nr:alpha/beta hydrolase [Ralstonia soli]MCO5398873.1 alpha/beta hydrolase [Ralstonia soli]
MHAEPLSLSMDIVADDAVLEGNLNCPANAFGLVIFAHGSGSSRLSPRNRYVADQLNAAGLGTLLFDLLSDDEAAHASCRFDIELLAQRLRTATRAVGNIARERKLRLGYFGASTGAAAAILAAADSDDACPIEAVVSRGGRPDLAGQHALSKLACPTLLIVGAVDLDVLGLNRQALTQMQCEKALETVPHATHLFEEAGALEQVAELARAWFVRHLRATAQPHQHTR